MFHSAALHLHFPQSQSVTLISFLYSKIDILASVLMEEMIASTSSDLGYKAVAYFQDAETL